MTTLEQKQTFIKRTGTTDKGKNYEDLLTALVAFKLTTDSNIEDFQLSSNDSKFDAFDDIVLKVFYKNKTKEQYVMQLKHTGKIITKDMLGAAKGDFSIQKYNESHKNIRSQNNDLEEKNHYVLYTCAKFEVNNGFTFKLTDEEAVQIETYKSDLNQDHFLKTSDNWWIYEFQIKGRKSDKYQSFFKSFLLFSGQKKVEAIESILRKMFQETFFSNSDSCDKYIKYIKSWSEDEGEKNYLNKETITVKLAEILLNPFLRSASSFMSDARLMWFQDALTNFDMIIFENGTIVDEIFNQKSNILGSDIIVIKFEKDEESLIYEVVGLFQRNIRNRKIILFGQDIDIHKFSSLVKILQDLSDLHRESDVLYTKFIENCTVSLQGRTPDCLSAVTKNCTDVEKIFSTTELLQICSSSLRIGEEKEELPEPHIDQHLMKTMIDSNFLSNSKISSLVVISCMHEVEKIQNQLKSSWKLIIRVPKHAQENFIRNLNTTYANAILIFEEYCTMENFLTIWQQNISQACHHFCLHSSGNLVWLCSKGSIEELSEYRLETLPVEVSDTVNLSSDINAISGEAGMGKSVLLKYLKNHLSSNFWILDINLRDHATLFVEAQEPQKIFEQILEHQNKIRGYSNFEYSVRNIFVKEKKVVLLWDGLDELKDSKTIQQAMESILSISILVHATWVTARSHLETTLQKVFTVFPLKVKPLDEKQQEVYVTKYLSNDHNLDEIKKIVVKIRQVLTTTSLGLLEIPLHLKILTELFHRNSKKYTNLVDNNFTLTNMIDNFVTEKVNFCFKDKYHLDLDDHLLQVLENNRKYQIRQYEILALEKYLSLEDFNSLPKIIFNDVDKMVKDNFGIVTKIDGSTVTFIHNSFGEYFVANWFVNHFQNVTNFHHFFFKNCYRNIRRMFDIILCEKYPAHLAVLSNSFEALLNCTKDEFDARDKMGRSPLHVACSYGQDHPSLLLTKSATNYVIDFSRGNLVQVDTPDYKKILQFLLDHYDFSETDLVFTWNCLNYAVNTRSLLAVDLIFEKCTDFGNLLEDIYDPATLMFHSIKFNYTNLFRTVENIAPYFEDQYESNILHQLCRWPDRDNFLLKILKNENYLEMINKKNCLKRCIFEIEGSGSFIQTDNKDMYSIEDDRRLCLLRKETPLHLASLSGNYKTVEILISHGADVNTINNKGSTPLHYAARSGQIEIVQLLRKHGACLNIFDCSNFSELHFAILTGKEGLVHHLLLEGCLLDTAEIKRTALNVAVLRNKKDMVKILIEKCQPSESYIYSALMAAISSSNEELVEYFLIKGVNVRKNFLNSTALHVAAEVGNLPIVKLLIQSKFALNAKKRQGQTPLYYAVYFNHYTIVKHLVWKGCSVNTSDIDGSNPLHLASRIGNDEIITYLLRHGCKVNNMNHNGNTPLHLAVYFGHHNAIKLLTAKGARMDIKNTKGLTPRMLLQNKSGRIQDKLRDSNKVKMNIYMEIDIPCDLVSTMLMMDSRIQFKITNNQEQRR